MDPIEMMEKLRADYWIVVLKALPQDMSYIIDGSRSEHDAPAPDRHIWKNKWVVECSCARHIFQPSKHRGRIVGVGDNAEQAMQNALNQIERVNHYVG